MTLYTERLYSSAFEDGFDYAVQKMYVNARQAKKNAKKARAEEEAAQQALEKEQFKAQVAEANKRKAEERAQRRAAEAANPPAPKPLSAAQQGKNLAAAASGASRSYQKAAVAAYDANQAARDAIGTSKYGALANEASKLRAVAEEKEQTMNAAKAARKEQKTQVRDAIKEQKQAESQRRMAIMAERAKKGGSAAAKDGLLNWIKKNPYKSAGIAAGLAAAGYGGYKFATRNKEDNSEE
jgi:hypothetical protein